MTRRGVAAGLGELRWSVVDDPAAADVEALERGLDRHSASRVGEWDRRPLAVFVRAPDGSAVGGLVGSTVWGWLSIRLLWVDERLQGQGVGSRLVRRAEAAAVERGCRHAQVDTFSFQAREFYERLGYQVFGRLDDFPVGETRFYLARRHLDAGSER